MTERRLRLLKNNNYVIGVLAQLKKLLFLEYFLTKNGREKTLLLDDFMAACVPEVDIHLTLPPKFTKKSLIFSKLLVVIPL